VRNGEKQAKEIAAAIGRKPPMMSSRVIKASGPNLRGPHEASTLLTGLALSTAGEDPLISLATAAVIGAVKELVWGWLLRVRQSR